jgi:hypothetical protein
MIEDRRGTRKMDNARRGTQLATLNLLRKRPHPGSWLNEDNAKISV